jgi:hypothetical protein
LILDIGSLRFSRKGDIMSNNDLIKNRYYIIKKDDEVYAYLSVKKDFYVEGILTSNKTFLSGFFTLYDEIVLIIWDNNLKDNEKIKGISIKSDTESSDINDNLIKQDYRLYNASVDEFGDVCDRNEISDSIKLIYITDENIIKDINYCIRQSKRDLNDIMKKYSLSFEHQRVGRLEELLSDINWYQSLHPEVTIVSEEAIKDLNNYLKGMKEKNQQQKISNNDNNKSTKKKIKKRKRS